MRVASGAARGLTLASALLAGCTSRPLVSTEAGGDGDDDDGADDTDDSPQPGDDGPPSGDDDDNDDDGDESGGDGSDGEITLSDDGPSDDGPFETSGDETDGGTPVDCPAPEIGDVRTTVWPGQDPLSHAQISLEVDCVIEERLHAGSGVSFELSCIDAGGTPLSDLVVVGVESDGIDVPASLTVGVEVHARVYTGRDLDDIAELPWRRANHFALYRDGALVLGAGEGVSFPSTATGEPYPDFFAPLSFDVLPSECPGDSMECHDLQRGTWGVSTGGEQTTSPPFTVVDVGAFAVHLGELVGQDTPTCGEPPYEWAAFAIASP